ncbi:unnamed protein product, partial [Closterium sp. NIES-53]
MGTRANIAGIFTKALQFGDHQRFSTVLGLLALLFLTGLGRPIQFDTWLDDLQLSLLSDYRDSVSLFDHTSRAAPTPPATADSATRSHWLTRDATARLTICNHLPLAECTHFEQHRTSQALYDAVVACYSSPATAALGLLLLPYLFPELSAFVTIEDLVSYLCTSDARYCAALPAAFLNRNPPPMYITLYFIVTCLPDSLRAVRDHFLALDPTALLAAETSVVAIRERFREDLPVLRLHSDRGDEFSSDLLQDFCRGEGILQSFTLPASPQQNGIGERRIGLVMEVARTSMIHAAAPHFLWPFAVWYAAHQLNLWPPVSLPETSPTLRWTGEVGDASVLWVWGSRAFVRDMSADKLSARAIPCIFLGFPHDAPGWQFYHPTTRPVFPSQDVTFDESVPFYRLFPYRSAPPPPPPLLLAPDPLPGTVPVEVAIGTGAASRGAAAGGAEPGGAESEGAGSGGAEPWGVEPGGAEPAGVEPGVAEPEGVEPGGAESEGAESGGAEPRGTASSGGHAGASPRLSPRVEPLSPQLLREWFAQHTRLRSGAAGAGVSAAGDTGAGGVGAARLGGTGVTAGAGGTGGAAAAGPGGARTRGTGAAGTGNVGDAGAEGAAARDPAEPRGTGARGTSAGGTGAGGAGAGDPGAVGVGAGGTGAGGAGVGDARAGDAVSGGTGAGGTVRPRSYFVPLLQQVLALPSSASPTPPLLCPPRDQSQLPLQPASPLPAPFPYIEQTGGLTERREPESCPASPVRAVLTGRRVPRPHPPLVRGTYAMALCPSSIPPRVPLPPPPESSVPAVPDPESDCTRATSPTVSCLLATVVTDPSFETTAASALVAELVDFAAACRLNYATALVAESESASPLSVGGECALGTDVLEDRHEDFECLAAAVPSFTSMLLASEGDPDAPNILTACSYAEVITGPYSSQWQAAMDADMASLMSICTYVDAVPPSRANIVDGTWIFRVKWLPGSVPAFKARYVARGFRQGVDYFQTFFPTPKMTTLWVLLHVAAQRDYELHSVDFSTAFLQKKPTRGDLPVLPTWLHWVVSSRTTVAALGFTPSTTDSSLFLHTDTSLPPFYAAHTSLGTARRTIILTQSHMVHQVLQRFGFQFSSPQPTPLSTSHLLSARPSDESVEPSGPYPELVGCLMYVMTCTRPDLAYPLSLLDCYVAPVVLTGHADASWVDDSATQQSSQGYTFSLGFGCVSRWSTRSSSVLSSCCEAEIYAGAMAAQELRWLTYLLTDLGEQPRSPPALYHGQLRVAYVATRANTADIFTKAVPPGDHQRFSIVLGLLALLFFTGLVTASPPCRGPALLPPQSRPCLCHCRGLCPAAAPVVALLCYRPCRGPALRPPTVAALPSPPVAAPNPSAALCRGPALQLPLSRPCPAPAPGKHPRCPAAPCRLLPRLATRNRAAPPCRAAPPSRAAPRCRAALPFCLHYLCCHSAATAATASMASPTVLTFDAEGRAVDFDMWVDDLQLFLLCDSRDGVSLFDHTSSVSTAPAATAGSTVRSQWTTHDAVARLTVRSHLPPGERAHFGKYKTAKSLYDAVVARYFSPATASLSRLMLPYIFPDLAAFATVADLITHLRTSDARYRAALPTEFSAKNPPPMYITLYYLATRLPDSLSSVRDHFLSLCPTELTVDLLEERLAAGENSILAVGASRGDRRTPFFEGCSPVPLLPSVASAAAIDLVGTEEVGAASGQVAASNLVFAAASRSSPASASCSCRPLTHETLLWHHRLGHPSLPRLRGMASHTLVSGLPRSLPPLPPGPAPTCVPSVEGRQRAAPHSSTFPPTEAPLQTLHMDVWGPARVRGQGHERYFLLVFDDYSRYTTVFPLRTKGETFTLPASPQQNGIAERRINMFAAHQINLQPRVSLPETTPTLRWTGKVGDASAFRVWGSRAFVRDTSADKLSSRAIPCVFLRFPPDAPGWQFYHPTSRRVLSSLDVTFDELVSYYRLFPYCIASLPPLPLFLAPGTPPVDPFPPQGPAPSSVSQVDPAEPPASAEPGGAAPKRVESGGAEPERVDSGGAEPENVEHGGAEPEFTASWGAEPACAESGGSPGVPLRRVPLSPQWLREWYARRCRRATGAVGAGAAGGAAGAGAAGGAAGARAAGGATGAGAAGAAGPGGTGGARTGGTGAAGGGVAAGVGAAGSRAAGAGATGGAAGAGAARGAAGAGAAGGAAGAGAAGGAAGAGAAGGAAGAGAAGGAAGAGAAGASGPGGARTGGTRATGVGGVAGGGATGTGAVTRDHGAEGTGAVSAVYRGAARPRPYYVPLLQQVLGPTPPLLSPPPVQSQSQFQPASPLPGPSPYSGPTRGLTERREPESRPVSPESHPASTESRSESPALTVRAGSRVSRPRPPPVPGTHSMTQRPSTAPQRVPLPSPPASSLPDGPYPESDSLRAASPTITRFLATAVTDPLFESTAASPLVAELADFSAACRLDFATSLVAESASASVCSSSVGGECALGTDVLEVRQEDFECFAAAVPPLVSMLLAPEGDPDAPDIPTPRSYAEAIEVAQHTEDDSCCSSFCSFTADPSLFLRTDTTLPPFYILLYVDNLVFATADIEAFAHVKSELQKRHTCADLGELTSYLGLRITRDRAKRTITLTRAHMVQQVLQRFGFTYSSPQSTPLPTGHSLSAPPSDESVEPSGPYPELVGCLISSCDAEIYAGAMTAQELHWLTYLLTDLGEAPRSRPVLYVNNKAMLALCQEHRLEHRTKHIALRYFLARELQQRGQLRLVYVASQANTADVFTKALQPCDHQHFCTVLTPVATATTATTATAATAATTATAATAATTATSTATAAAATTAPACCATMASLRVLAFDHDGRPIQFDTWLDDLQLYLLSDSKDSVSLFDLTSGAATAPPATADSATRSQTAQALYDAVAARYSSPATPALGRLLLPYLFPELSAFATVEDLVSHLRTSDPLYRTTVPAEFLNRNQPPMFITLYFIVTRLPDSLRSVRDHFISLDPTSLTVDLFEKHLLATETSAVAVGAARGTPRTPFIEGCSPSPLAPSHTSAATPDIRAAAAPGATAPAAAAPAAAAPGAAAHAAAPGAAAPAAAAPGAAAPAAAAPGPCSSRSWTRCSRGVVGVGVM